MPILRRIKSQLRKLPCFPTLKSRSKPKPRYPPPPYPAMSFPNFQYLPTELRLRIWNYACPAPRMIELSWNSKARCVVSKTPPPALLSACHESQRNFIKAYEAVQLSDCLGKPSRQIIRIDFSRDTLFIGPDCKHLIPAGKSKPWVTQNPAILRTVLKSGTLMSQLRVILLDANFIIAMTGLEDLVALFKGLDEMKEVAVQVAATDPEYGDVELRCAWSVVHRALADSETTKRLKIDAIIQGEGPDFRIAGASFLGR